jgi:hypothetical protein
MSHIVVALDGGLGNQMFQYAAGRATSLRLRLPLTVDLRPLRHRSHRRYGLDAFQGCAGLPIAGQESWLNRLFGRFAARPTHLTESGFAFDERILSIAGPARLEGYFQSERYFAEHAATIRRDFLPGTEERDRIEALASRLLPAGPCVSLHVRRGDYVHPEVMATHGLMGPDYYERALRMVAKRAGPVVVCVFSDDPAWVRANLALPPDTRFISEQTRSALQDLILMSRCTHHITANSSFSWWGAWLNPSPDKTVVTPERWFQPASGLDTRDLRPAGWLQA